MLEARCCTNTRSHGNTEHFIFLKTISNKENKKEKKKEKKLVSMRVEQLLWELCSTLDPKTV